MNNFERRVERLENPSRGPLEGLAEAMDALRPVPGEPPRVDTPEDIARFAEQLREMEARVAAGARLSRWDEFVLSTLRYQVAGGVT